MKLPKQKQDHSPFIDDNVKKGSGFPAVRRAPPRARGKAAAPCATDTFRPAGTGRRAWLLPLHPRTPHSALGRTAGAHATLFCRAH
jgi:hypothetical protein